MGAISSLFGYVLNFLYNLVNNYGIAIILFTILLRLILLPITILQQKSMKKNEKMQEKMREIQTKYKNDPERLNQATIDLYKTEKMNPFSGCLISILQILIILSVFWVVSMPLTYMKGLNKVAYDESAEDSKQTVVEYYSNKLKEENENQKASYTEIAIIDKYGVEDERVSLNMNFLGLDLSKVPSQNFSDPKVYILPILYVITSVLSIKITNNMQGKKKKKTVEVLDKNENPEEQSMESMEQMTKSMNYMVPIMSISIAFIAPLGLALYWFVSNLLMILERVITDKFFNKEKEIDENV